MAITTKFRYTVSSPEAARDKSVCHFRELFAVIEAEAPAAMSLEQINRAIEMVVADAGEIMWLAGRASGIRAATQVTITEDLPLVPGAGRDC